MEIYLDEKELLEHVRVPFEQLMDPYEIQRGDSAETQASKSSATAGLKKLDKKCKRFIIQSLGNSQLLQVRSKETANEIWTYLEIKYEKKTPVTRMMLKKKLSNLEFRPSSETFDEYCVKYDALIMDLKRVGEMIDDMGNVLQFLMTMPEEYDAVVSGLETLATERLTMEFCRLRISEEEAKRKEKKTGRSPLDVTDASPTAFAGSRYQDRSLKRFGKSHLVCHNCKLRGHKVTECWRPSGRMYKGADNLKSGASSQVNFGMMICGRIHRIAQEEKQGDELEMVDLDYSDSKGKKEVDLGLRRSNREEEKLGDELDMVDLDYSDSKGEKEVDLGLRRSIRVRRRPESLIENATLAPTMNCKEFFSEENLFLSLLMS
ncbi:uncharacterized protein LOC124155294 [Ischnura elegans]|uniref:uncharacterized protein LOC124155294 n=1 Tax=Ischnura elegans TaxID=197161 RepID=UPI001ED8AE07|nr:uncharacterized protein LOC124155294 [Ischnura elegans]